MLEMTVSFDEYNKEFMEFVEKNRKSEMKIYTSPMENNKYHKEYFWENGSAWYEVTGLVSEKIEVQAYGITFNVEVEMWKTEFWSTENKSKYYYSK